MAVFKPASFAPPQVPGIGQFTAAIKPIVPKPRPRPAVAEPVPAPTVASTGDGLTIDALMSRARDAANAQQGTMQQDAGTIMGGLSQLGWTVVNALKQRAAEKELATGQQEVADAFGKMDWSTGQLPPEAMQTLFRRDPENAMQLYQTAMALRAQQAKTENWVAIPTPAGETGQWYRNTVNNEEKKIGGSTEGGGPKISDSSSMVGHVLQDPSYKNLKQAQPIWDSMVDAATRKSPQAHHNLVIGLAKLYDPTSVVRTQEGEQIIDTGGLPSSVYSAWQWLKGNPDGTLKDDVVRGLMQEGQSRVKGYSAAYDETVKTWQEYATRHGMDPADIPLVSVKPYAPAEEEAQKPPDADTPPDNTGPPVNPDTGKPYIPPSSGKPVKLKPDGSVDFTDWTTAEMEEFIKLNTAPGG